MLREQDVSKLVLGKLTMSFLSMLEVLCDFYAQHELILTLQHIVNSCAYLGMMHVYNCEFFQWFSILTPTMRPQEINPH